MSPRQATKAPPRYVSGHCGIGRCGACWGHYAGATCTHACHTPEPAPTPEPPAVCGECGRPLEDVARG